MTRGKIGEGFWMGAVVGLLVGLGGGMVWSVTGGRSAPAPSTTPTQPDLAAQVTEEVLRRLDQQQGPTREAQPSPGGAAAPASEATLLRPTGYVGQGPTREAQPSPGGAASPTSRIERPKVDRAVWKDRVSTYRTDPGMSPAVGSDKALVKVFVISDFQCPVCKRAAEGVAELFAVFGDEVQFIFWHNPLDMHSKALPMAMASMAAGEQGKFWEYHDRMFENARLNSPQDLEAHATALGLDLERFRKDLESPALLAKVRSDQGAAELLLARGTPALVVNGRLQVGWGSTGGLEHMIRQELSFVETLVKGGASLEEALLERGRANAKSPELAEVFLRHFLKGELAARP